MAKLSEKMGCGPYQSKIRWRSLCFIVLKLVEPNNGNNPPPLFFFCWQAPLVGHGLGLQVKG
jgi:hypothetical protein